MEYRTNKQGNVFQQKTRFKYSLMTLANLVPVIMMSKEKGEQPPLSALEDLFYAAKNSGIEAVDLTTLEISAYGKETARELLGRYEMKLGALINFSSIAIPDFAGDIRREAVEAAALAKYFGSGIVMVVPALLGVEITQSADEMRRLLIKNLSEYAKVCKAEGIIPVIEDTPDLRIPLCSMEDMDRIFGEAPDLCMVYDSGNMILVHEKETEYYSHFSHLIRHVHLKDMGVCDADVPFAERDEDGVPYQSVQQGCGSINLPGVYECLRESGYEGYLVIEYAGFLLDRKGHEAKLKEIMEYLGKL